MTLPKNIGSIILKKDPYHETIDEKHLDKGLFFLKILVYENVYIDSCHSLEDVEKITINNLKIQTKDDIEKLRNSFGEKRLFVSKKIQYREDLKNPQSEIYKKFSKDGVVPLTEDEI